MEQKSETINTNDDMTCSLGISNLAPNTSLTKKNVNVIRDPIAVVINFNDFVPKVQQILTMDKLEDITDNIANIARTMKRIFGRPTLVAKKKWTKWTEGNKDEFSTPQSIVKKEFVPLITHLLKEIEYYNAGAVFFYLVGHGTVHGFFLIGDRYMLSMISFLFHPFLCHIFMLS